MIALQWIEFFSSLKMSYSEAIFRRAKTESFQVHQWKKFLALGGDEDGPQSS